MSLMLSSPSISSSQNRLPSSEQVVLEGLARFLTGPIKGDDFL